MRPLHLSLFAFVLAAPSAFALKSDTQQPVYIDSNSQQLDMRSNQVIFEGNVSLKQGSISITAERIVVTRGKEKNAIHKIEAFGKPATFSQLTDDGRTLSGKANQLDYEVTSDQLVMLGQAELSQDGNVIKGSSIKYQIAQQKLIADSSHNERVTTVLQPSQANN
ncbi:lipopolysaccharide transport periplasmic protein LptA [Vibrio cidicii]|jgi:lipopolysaccharide export system protein LptA|uniref:Lipopolysaccharide export system protein LptA n=1 Tax=Vibrio cidicii TaxID=1763883 RepID=A0A151KTX3_9VIBR|nr:lipopolysaccharide transport periplasmic protein LptA [Vibrio cidicii]EJN6828100.1 lipopolysaccharide transport periplasmic protein LptA [Vibrio cidicii]ELV8623747.1 lipopolysaccharide transport periplasmic protein LptA [Vibrio cidicii]KYN25807.1 lipopolysaccharide transport periplasmic protein LptA [Vibrio cidicii]KYN80824.1 lipopolysaccharide transport periplasmic protein LptA [Vibrio cidicii]KYN81457.1 lipopolysaccharide transport periplasmic protein LptA [Vibrio cidicii]